MQEQDNAINFNNSQIPCVSVVIPVYNAEKYIIETLNSLISQSLKNIEIICVDDGSTDNSLEILTEFAKRDNRIKILTQHNLFAGIARNNGLKAAVGEYIIFLDADDIFKPVMLEKLYNIACDKNSDITICKSNVYNQDTETFAPLDYSVKMKYLNGKTVFSPDEISKYIFQFCVGWAWDKLYKREFLIRNNLQFQDLRHSNDTSFVLTSLVLAEKITVTDEILLTYRIHSDSLAATRIAAPECFYSALKKLRENLENFGKYKLYEQSYANYCIEFANWHKSTIKDTTGREIITGYLLALLEETNFSGHFPAYYYSSRLYRQTLWLYMSAKILKLCRR